MPYDIGFSEVSMPKAGFNKKLEEQKLKTDRTFLIHDYVGLEFCWVIYLQAKISSVVKSSQKLASLPICMLQRKPNLL